jgi:hypothetical protein
MFPIVVDTLGYSSVNTLLMTVPPYIIGVIGTLTNAWHADRTGERYLHIAIPPVVAIVAYIILVSTLSFGARYFAMCIVIAGSYCGYVVCVTQLTSDPTASG